MDQKKNKFETGNTFFLGSIWAPFGPIWVSIWAPIWAPAKVFWAPFLGSFCPRVQYEAIVFMIVRSPGKHKIQIDLA